MLKGFPAVGCKLAPDCGSEAIYVPHLHNGGTIFALKDELRPCSDLLGGIPGNYIYLSLRSIPIGSLRHSISLGLTLAAPPLSPFCLL